MKSATEIQLLGTPSTKYTYINHILKKVIERSGISVDLKEVTDVKELLKLNIDAIPLVRINNKAFDFSNGSPTNERLKELILYLLDNEGFGHWPLISLISEDLKPDGSYLFARELSIKTNAVIDWYTKNDRGQEDYPHSSVSREHLDAMIRSTTKDWRGQLFSSPLTRYYKMSGNLPAFTNENSLTRSSLIIIDGHWEKSTSLLREALFTYRIPVILLKGDQHLLPFRSICVLHEQGSELIGHPLLTLLSGDQGTNDPLQKPNVYHKEYTEGQLMNEIHDLTLLKANHPLVDAITFQFTQPQNLEQIIKDPELISRDTPIIFLPIPNQEDSHTHAFRNPKNYS